MNKKLKILKYFLGSQICYQVQKQAMMLPTSFNLPMGLEESFSWWGMITPAGIYGALLNLSDY